MEGKVLFNHTVFYLRLFGTRHMVKDHSDRKEICGLRFMGYSFRLAASNVLYAPHTRLDSTYHNLCYTSVKGETHRVQNDEKQIKTGKQRILQANVFHRCLVLVVLK